jgi:hypothetical protein
MSGLSGVKAKPFSRTVRNRRSHNPMTRVYESNGPDVKIRGTAHHVAEKYLQLARDAQTSGDPVSAEGYLQHAEHYFRLIAAAQQQFQQANPNFQGQPFQRNDEFRADADEDDIGDDGDDSGYQPYPSGAPVQQQQPPRQQHQPQQHTQHNQRTQHAQHNEQPEPEGGLPAFITGGAQPAPAMNGPEGDANEPRNERFGRNRRRNRFRPRGQGDDRSQGAEFSEGAPAPKPVEPAE